MAQSSEVKNVRFRWNDGAAITPDVTTGSRILWKNKDDDIETWFSDKPGSSGIDVGSETWAARMWCYVEEEEPPKIKVMNNLHVIGFDRNFELARYLIRLRTPTGEVLVADTDAEGLLPSNLYWVTAEQTK